MKKLRNILVKQKSFFLIFLIIFSFLNVQFVSAQTERVTHTVTFEENQAEIKAKPPVLFNGMSLSCVGEIEEPDITAYSAYVIHLDTGSVIYSKNEKDIVYPTSTVKLMTGLVALENIPDLDIQIPVSDTAVRSTKGTHLGLKSGEMYTANQLLHAMLISGANDAANVLAEYVGGTIENFCQMMNEKAKEIGAVGTNYTNPMGIHDDSMITTAYDTALIALHSYYNNTLFEMTNTGRYEIPATSFRKNAIVAYNRNSFISQVRGSDYYYSGASGLNAGGTSEGGWCLVTTASKRGTSYLCVVMNSKGDDEKNINYSYKDAKTLLDMSFSEFSYQTVLSPKNLVKEIPVKNSAEIDHLTLYPKNEIEMLLPVNLNKDTDISFDLILENQTANAPVLKGDEFGEITVIYKGSVILGKTKLIAQTDIDRSNLLYFFNNVELFLKSRWFKATAGTAVILFSIYIATAFFVKRKRKKYKYRNNGR